MDSLGYLRRALVRPARATERTGPHRLEGSSGGRLVRTGEKRGNGVGNTKCGKGCKVVDIVDTKGTPLAVHITAANHNEVKLIEPTLDQLQLPHRVPEHLIYDRAADSDALPKRLMDQRGSNWFAHIAKAGRQSPRRMVEPVESTSDATKWNGPTAGSTTSAERSFATKPHCCGTPAGSTWPAS